MIGVVLLLLLLLLILDELFTTKLRPIPIPPVEEVVVVEVLLLP
jgi:hypothetical protein